MSAARRRRKREPSGRGLVASFAVELFAGVVAIPAFALGLLVIAVFFQTAAEESEALWQVIVAFAVAGAAAVGGLLLVGWFAATRLATAAAGWVAMASGQRPVEFRDGQHNGARGLAGIVLTCGAGALGVMLFRVGAAEGELNWAIEGVFLAASGGVFGLGAAVPRLYFALVRRAPVSSWHPDGVITFVLAATLGIGLSLGITMGFGSSSRVVARQRALHPSRWTTACVHEPAVADCVVAAKFELIASTAGFYRIDLRGRCARIELADAAGSPLPTAGWPELRRLNIRPVDVDHDMTTTVVTLAAAQPIALTVTPTRGERCSFKVRYARVVEGAP